MSNYTSRNYTLLRIFNKGLLLDLCVEPSNTFGKLFPSIPDGVPIKLGDIRDLKAKGLIAQKTIIYFGLEYKRYSISQFGKAIFEEYKNEHSN